MALGTVKRLSVIPLALAFALVQGCFSTSSGDDAGCSKDTDCASGRICENRSCVPNPILSGGSGGSGGASGSSGSSGMGGTSGAGGSTTGGTGGSGVGCLDTDPILCPSPDQMSLCINGTYQTLACDTACTTLGFEVGPCAEPGGCACGYPTNADCELGVNAFCACVEDTDTPCDGTDPLTDPLNLYVSCHLNDPPEDATFLLCLAEQIDAEGSIDCQAAADVCIPQ